MSDSRTRVWLSIGGAFVTAAIVTAVAFNLTAADSHDTGHTALEEETATVNQPEHVDEPEPIAPVGPFDEAAYRETLEVRVACANGLLGDDLIGLVPDRNGKTHNVSYDVTERDYDDLESALNECKTPEGLGIERAWLADIGLTPEDFPQAISDVAACAERRGVDMPTGLADEILSTTGEAQAEAIFALLDALSTTPAEVCWHEAGFGDFSN